MKRRVLGHIVVLLFALIASVYLQQEETDRSGTVIVPSVSATTTKLLNENHSTSGTNATIIHMIDGDTALARMDTESADVKVRFLGINTPETVDQRKKVECFGKEASEKGKQLLPDGARVRMEADPSADERDRYNRLLRIVYMANGEQYNSKMVKEGFATAYVSFPMSAVFKRELKESEQHARIGQLGLWSPTTCNGIK